MRDKTNLGGGFTLAGTSLLDRMATSGSGAHRAIFPMQSRFCAKLWPQV